MDLSNWSAVENSRYLYGLASAVVFLYTLWILVHSGPRRSTLGNIPSVGPDGLLFSYLGAFKWLTNAKQMMREGYNKYKGTPFKVANINRWLVVVSSPKLVEELRKAEDDELSFMEAMVEELALDYTFGPGVHTDPYHVLIVRNEVTKNLGVLFPQIRDEIVRAFDENIPSTSDWIKVRANDTVMQIVCRIANRLFVGTPLCWDSDWLALNSEFTIDVAKGAAIINLFPNFLKPIAGRLLTNVHAQVKRGMRHLVPIIKDRQRYIDEYGKDWDDKPNDLLSWVMDYARGDEKSYRNLTLRILLINFTAIHTTTMSFTHALYFLAAMPHYIQPLREEVEAVIGKDGWSRASLGNMHKVDSFLKETQRYGGLGVISMTRKALKDFTFSDGTVIPKNTFVCAASFPIHHDEEYYANSDVFDGFRFSDMRISEGENKHHQLVATHASYLPFGYGKHACPGRFFAANELKAMLAHLVLNYDVKLENEGVRPTDMSFGASCIPNQTAEVLFRKRQL
jgi:cytochrome P450